MGKSHKEKKQAAIERKLHNVVMCAKLERKYSEWQETRDKVKKYAGLLQRASDEQDEVDQLVAEMQPTWGADVETWYFTTVTVRPEKVFVWIFFIPSVLLEFLAMIKAECFSCCAVNVHRCNKDKLNYDSMTYTLNVINPNSAYDAYKMLVEFIDRSDEHRNLETFLDDGQKLLDDESIDTATKLKKFNAMVDELPVAHYEKVSE